MKVKDKIIWVLCKILLPYIALPYYFIKVGYFLRILFEYPNEKGFWLIILFSLLMGYIILYVLIYLQKRKQR